MSTHGERLCEDTGWQPPTMQGRKPQKKANLVPRTSRIRRNWVTKSVTIAALILVNPYKYSYLPINCGSFFPPLLPVKQFSIPLSLFGALSSSWYYAQHSSYITSKHLTFISYSQYPSWLDFSNRLSHLQTSLPFNLMIALFNLTCSLVISSLSSCFIVKVSRNKQANKL